MAFNNSGPESLSFAFRSPAGCSNSFTSSSMNGDVLDGTNESHQHENNEEMSRIQSELDATRRQCNSEQQRVSELEEQLNLLSMLFK